MNEKINDNKKLLWRFVIVLLILAILYYVSDVLVPVIISFILFYILNPIVTLLSCKRPKGLNLPVQISILIAFALIFSVFYLFFRFIIPPLANEFRLFGQNIPKYISEIKQLVNNLRMWYAGQSIPQSLENAIIQSFNNLVSTAVSLAEQIIKSILSVSSRFIQLIIIPILTYYLLKDKDSIKKGVISLLPFKNHNNVEKGVKEVNDVLNNYIKGVTMLCFFIGTTSTIGLFLLGVKYYIILGIIAGITEAIPFIGPWIGGVPAVTIAFLTSPILALKVFLFYMGLQLLENSILVPKILGVKLNLHPIAIIIAMLVLGKLIGAFGLFFAAPILAILRIIYLEIQEG